MKFDLNPYTALVPVPVVMVSCGTMENANITTIAWTGVINSEPPIVYISIRKTRKSYEIIKNTKEFVLNIPDESLVWHVDFCGTKSGKNIDKFKEANLHKEKSKVLNVPIIKECPINIECKVTEIRHFNSHEMIIGEIVNIKAEEKYKSENNILDYSKMNLITFMGKDYFVSNKKIANRGICLEKD